MKEFNIEGTCIPSENYMVDTSAKLEQIEALIQKGKYFTINRSRQYGKTTTLASLYHRLKNQYTVLRLSFEGVGDGAFASDYGFVRFFVRKTTQFMEFLGEAEALIREWSNFEKYAEGEDAFDFLDQKITLLCQNCDREIIVMIDEVDKSSDNQIFLNFLGMLRNKYLRRREGLDTTFKSVILAGVYDIKNLKLKIRSDGEKKYNSPWNIAADFMVDMSFSPVEIASMLQDYERDYHTGMDIEAISRELYFYTSGYPFLVSRLCKWIDEEGEKNWTVENVRRAENALLHIPCTLFDDLAKNYENNPQLQQMIDDILFTGREYTFVMTDPVISLGVMFGIFKRSGNIVAISNVIFDTILYNHVMSKMDRQNLVPHPERRQFIEDGKLNMPHVLTKFQELMKAEYRSEDGKFLERQGRLLFLCFLKPIINGSGFYFVEPETRNSMRMDIVVVYGKEEFIVELKMWHGWQYRKAGIRQLEEYMDSRNAEKGYLVSFSFLQRKQYSNGWVSEDTGKRIFEVVV